MAPDTLEVKATLTKRAVKKAEELGYKLHKVAIIVCVNQLAHWIHVMLKRQEAFVDLV